jgi:hypothetical protein
MKKNFPLKLISKKVPLYYASNRREEAKITSSLKKKKRFEGSLKLGSGIFSINSFLSSQTIK